MCSLNGIVTILDDYDAIYGDYQLTARIRGLTHFLETRAAEEYHYHAFKDAHAADDAVQIMTVHKAKGLEFEAVILPELQEREFPVGNMGGKKYWHVLGGRFEETKARYQSDLEDERKLFYVAVTRAKRELRLLFQTSRTDVSCFVVEASKSSYLKHDPADLVAGFGNRSALAKKSKAPGVRLMAHQHTIEKWLSME